MLYRLGHVLSVAVMIVVIANSRAADTVVYSDGLQNGWENWSWAQVAPSSNPAHAGTTSLAVTADAWEAIYLHNSNAGAASYTNLSFWIHGGPAGGQRLLVQGVSSTNPKSFVQLEPLAPSTWKLVTVSLEQLGVANDSSFDGFWIQDRSGTTQPTFFVDDILLTAGSAPPISTNSTVSIQVDAAAAGRPISPLIYGVAFASSAQLDALNAPLNRSGGNAESRYNWQLNAHNRGFDWYFESLPDASSNPGAETDAFIEASRNAGAEPMVTVPMIGWVAKLGAKRGRLSSFSITKYGQQTGRDAQWFPDAGNGILASNNQPISNNDPNDANVLTDSNFQRDWVRHLTERWGSAAQDGVRYYMLDNEPSLWHSTHRDVVKTGLKMGELRDRMLEYAAKVRAVDQAALIAGPEEWGWSGYIFSGYDQQWGSKNGWSNLPDRTANGGMDYLPWVLQQLHQHDQQSGARSLDIFTVHYYPQSGEYSSDTSNTAQQRRNRSTRSLWDPNYRDESWINDRVRLIPRLKEWVNNYYPGLQTGITEYSWGADDHINGATAQADILGILGREGLDLATRWVVPATGTPTFKAIQMYRNYDGAKSTFGDLSLPVTVPNPDALSAFAAVRSSDRALTLMVINKVTSPTPVSVALAGFNHTGKAQLWQLTSANQIVHLPDLTLTGETLTNTVAAQSITLFVLPAPTQILPTISATADLDRQQLRLELTGEPNRTYRIESSPDLLSWTAVGRLPLTTSASTTNVNATANHRFFRALRE